MNNESFIYVEPYVFTAVDNEKALFYNTLSGQHLLLKLNKQENGEFLKSIISSPTRSVQIDKQQSNGIWETIQQLRDMHFCDIIMGGMPFIEPMSCKVLFNKSQAYGNYKRIISWVNQLSVISNNGLFTDMDVFVNRKKYNTSSTYNIERVREFFSNIHFEKLKEVDYVGKYKSFDEIRWIFQVLPNICFSLHVNYMDVDFEDFKRIRSLCNQFHVILCFDRTVDKAQLCKVANYCNDLDIEFKGACIVESQNDIGFLESNTFNFKVIAIPLYDFNFDFIYDNICLSENDILSQKMTQENILTNMTVNSNFFGELILMPDNQIYTSFNSKPIGALGDEWCNILDSLSDSSWFLTRNKMEPCSKCVFQYLCPPPSNYEIAIGKPNLCTVKP